MITFETVKSRHSVRAYIDKPIETDKAEALQSLIDECNAEGGLHIQLVLDEPDAFGKSLMAHYGKFSNVSNYIALVAQKSDRADELLGYYGEKAVLKAQALGLNTCWVGLTFSKKNARIDVRDGEKVYAIIALGYGATQGAQSKVKPAEVIGGKSYADAPEWYRRGVEWAVYAPSSINQRKYRFELTPDGKVKETSAWGPFSKMDMGIARCHFELGAGREIVWAGNSQR